MRVKLTILLLLCCLANLGAAQNNDKPNIILINIDDMGWTDIAAFGSKYYKTPHIDRLISQGMKFTNAYAGAANCAPSRACLISGQASPRHGVYTVNSSERGHVKTRKLIPEKNTLHLPAGTRTFGHAMTEGGYETITLGKWHVGNDPLEQGFKHNAGGSYLGGPYTGGYHSPFKYPNCEVEEEGTYLTDYLTDKAINFIKENKQKPFFIYFPYFALHVPLQPKPEKLAKFKKIKSSEAHKSAAYAAMIESLDENIGRLVTSLAEQGLAEKTLVLFTTDNGGVWQHSKNWPLRSGKGSYYEGGIRVPTWAYWPGKIKAGTVCDVPITALDIYPTLLGLGGIEKKKDKILDGESFVELLHEKKPKFDVKRPLVWHFPIYLQGGNSECQDLLFRTRPGSIIRVGDWKLHQYFEDGTLELYNLKDDIGEKVNLAEKYPDKVKELMKALNKWRLETNAPVPIDLNPEYDSEYDLAKQKDF